ncbi:MAG: chloride channel protein [Proteobacteria bacterium]|nr:chloride channel protein [Pseudomonadota bacterium]MBU1386731.1 chloride channel protein [Pseudomonadota bacterium]MBU1544379.1 chloride channel protein [Pseudomonadota bacterium]MBU2479928.1 chloride channel protein [Pseudomonadota bacterium]
MSKIKNWYMQIYHKLFHLDDRLLLIIVGSIAGMCSGLAAVALRLSLEHVFEWLHPFRQYGWAFVLPAVGAVLSSFYLEKIAREGAGHGVPEVIYSVSRYGGLLRFRSSYSRLIASFLTIGSGGSAGPEAPVVMSGSAIGSNLAKFLGLNDRQRITLVGCGTAGAIAAIFNAPIAGLVFSVEVILGEWKFVNIIPIAIAAVAGTQVSHAIIPEQVIFNHIPFAVSYNDIFPSICLAGVTALISIVFTKTLRQTKKIAQKTSLSFWSKALLGGCTVGLIGIYMPVVLGEGYHFIQSMISGTFSMGVFVIFVAVFAKIFATAITLGWGGSGGIFAPSLLIGSLIGIFFHKFILLIFPNVEIAKEGAYALFGMTGIISGVMQAPLTGIFLIVEITGGYETILPLILVSSISSTMSHYIEPASFYFKELIERGQFLRPGTDERILADLNLGELIETGYDTFSENMVFRDFIEALKSSNQNFFPVIEDDTGVYKGVIQISAIRKYVLDPGVYDMIFLNQIMDTDVLTASLENGLQEVLDMMENNNMDTIPVVEHERFVGMISKNRILDLYRRELIMQTSVY